MTMQAERCAWLVDEDTQFPLPLYPTLDAPIVITKKGKPYHKDPDDHHFFFPRRTFTADNLPPGGQVVRLSRIQSTRRYHHDAAHRLMAPPTEVTDPSRQLGMSVLALSGFIPRQAIDVRGCEPAVVDLNDNEYALLQQMTRVDFTRSYHTAIGRFFLNVMLKDYNEAICPNMRCEFLEAKYGSPRKRVLGMRIMKVLSLEAAAPLNPTVQGLKQSGEIPKDQPSPYETMLTYTRSVRASSLHDMLVAQEAA